MYANGTELLLTEGDGAVHLALVLSKPSASVMEVDIFPTVKRVTLWHVQRGGIEMWVEPLERKEYVAALFNDSEDTEKFLPYSCATMTSPH